MTVKSYAMKPERVSKIYLESQPSNTITRFSFSFCSFFPPLRLNIISLFKKLVKQVLKIAWKLSLRPRESSPRSESAFLQWRRREVKVDPKLGGQWKVPSLVAIGRIQSLVAYWNVKDKHLFTSSIFPQQLYLHPQFFPLSSRFYVTMVLSRYSRLSFLFLEL